MCTLQKDVSSKRGTTLGDSVGDVKLRYVTFYVIRVYVQISKC